MFRCPFCGEKVFLKISKLGFRTKFGFAPKCPECKKTTMIETLSYIKRGSKSYSISEFISIFIIKSITTLEIINGLIVLCAFALYYFFHIISGVTCVIVNIIAIGFYFFYNYYLCHYLMYTRQKKELPKMYVKTAETKKLWPNFRNGEIYVIVPDELRDPGKEEFQTIAFLENKEKTENGCVFVFNVIRAPYV